MQRGNENNHSNKKQPPGARQDTLNAHLDTLVIGARASSCSQQALQVVQWVLQLVVILQRVAAGVANG